MFSKKIKKEVKIEGMMCDHCKSKVESAFSSIEDVTKVKVNLKDKSAFVYSTKSISNDIIKNKIDDLGYKIISIEDDK